MPSTEIDGANVLAVEDAVRAAVDRARSGAGPSFIEARVYRFRAHGGSGDDTRTGYRHEAEPAAWLPFDPIAMFGAYLASRNVLNEADVAGMEDEIQREIAEAFDFALASPNPTEADLYKHVYAD